MSNPTWRLGTVSNHLTAFVLREKRSIKYGQLSDASCALVFYDFVHKTEQSNEK